MHAPIYGSQINLPAKLFKRFMPTESVTIGSQDIIYENQYYRSYCALRYVESTERQEGEEQPINGLVTRSGYMTIKYNGKYRFASGSLYEAEVGDLLLINKELWIVEDGVQRIRYKSLANLATVYLPLRKIL